MKAKTATLLLAALAANSCYTNRAMQPSLLASNPASRVWVTLADRSKVVVDSPRVTGDTLMGKVVGVPRAFPTSRVLGLAKREAAPYRTTAVVLVSAGAATVATVLIYDALNPTHSNPLCVTGPNDTIYPPNC